MFATARNEVGIVSDQQDQRWRLKEKEQRTRRLEIGGCGQESGAWNCPTRRESARVRLVQTNPNRATGPHDLKNDSGKFQARLSSRSLWGGVGAIRSSSTTSSSINIIAD
jgi:hypothetical protein